MTSIGTQTWCHHFNEKYKRCGLLNSIQHIDIYGKIRTTYVENRKMDNSAVTSVSSYCKKFVQPVRVADVNSRLSQFTVKTKVSGLYPGNDILSKKKARTARTNLKNNLFFGTVMVR
ncbi:unnamed protein product [Colias eurytheme]|nr:unnamed protein product [Colias eurytheme]